MFNVMHFINNARIILGDDEDTSNTLPVTRYINVMFRKPCYSGGDCSISYATPIFENRKNKESKELFIDYDAEYNFE